ncbi:hypothetical protein KUW00_05105 [Halomonas sp. DP5N14-9]|uniref:hypothetical protein n=1 Tax=Halomonas sp. DP5N14-9 TaxID=2859075 RepID=UPI001C99AE48|nr:hypothetical protein [Halomonas sp. DP5N14-9]MBY5940265.1 hypothetical protein [Halomonas sp. DP5N14-9]
MKIRDLKRRILVKRIAGSILSIASFYVMVISFLVGLVLALEENYSNNVSYNISSSIRLLLSKIWLESPLDGLVSPLNLLEPVSADNLGFLGLYVAFIVGAYLFSSAGSDARMIRQARKRQQERELDRAMDGEEPRRFEIDDVDIYLGRSKNLGGTFWNAFFIPLVVAVLSGIILKLLGAD